MEERLECDPSGLLHWHPAVSHAMPMAVAAWDRRAPGTTMTVQTTHLVIRRVRHTMMDILPPVSLAGACRRGQVIRMAAFAYIAHGICRNNGPFQVFPVDPAPQQHDISRSVRFVAIKTGEDKIIF